MFLEVLKRVAVLDVCLLKRVKKKTKNTHPKHKQTNFKQVWVILEKSIREN